MDNDSTTGADNPSNASDAPKDPITPTDDQPAASSSDNLDPSKSTDKPADGDTPADPAKADDTPASPKFDDDLDKWIEKRKLTPATTDEQRQSYQDLRNEQREYSKSRQADKTAEAAKDLNKTVDDVSKDFQADDDEDDDDDDPNTKRIKAIEDERNAERTVRLQSEFYVSNKVSDDQAKALQDVFKDKMQRLKDAPMTDEQKRTSFKYWSSPEALPDLLDLAKARLSGDSVTAAADEAAKQTREEIAKESEANQPGRGAKTTTVADQKTVDEQRLAKFRRFHGKE